MALLSDERAFARCTWRRQQYRDGRHRGTVVSVRGLGSRSSRPRRSAWAPSMPVAGAVRRATSAPGPAVSKSPHCLIRV